MIAALIAGAVLALVMGFAIGWAWDKREGALAGVSVLSVLTAFGTIGAVGTAIYLAHKTQNKEFEFQKRLLEDKRKDKLATILGVVSAIKFEMLNLKYELSSPIDESEYFSSNRKNRFTYLLDMLKGQDFNEIGSTSIPGNILELLVLLDKFITSLNDMKVISNYGFPKDWREVIELEVNVKEVMRIHDIIDRAINRVKQGKSVDLTYADF